MDWMQFTASVIGSLAWPSVVVVLLILIRKQLGGLVARIEELNLPGGTSAKFGRALEEIREKVEAARTAERPPKNLMHFRTLDSGGILTLAEDFPEAAVMEGFRLIEEVIQRNKSKLPDVPKGTLFSYVKALGQ